MSQAPISYHEPPLSTQELGELLLFRGESPEALEWVLNMCEVRTLPRGTVLLDPARDNDTLYLLLSGRVQVKLDIQGHETLMFVEAGNCVGEMSIIERTRPSAKVITDTESRVVMFKDEVLWSLINRSHAVARNLLYILSSRVRNDNNVLMASLEQQRIYEENAKVDSLTGLHNRRWMDEVLDRLVERCHVDHLPLSLLMLDVDHFKAYNDSNGHVAGDMALSAVAGTIGNHIRSNDTAVRYGGEEFIVVMPGTSVDNARIIAQRLCNAVRNQAVRSSDGSELPGVTISIGLAGLNGGHSREELIAAADAALYRAKHAGRDRVSQ